MRIAVASQNFRTITAHAGKTRRFIIFDSLPDGGVVEADRLDLPKDMSLHAYHGNEHPLYKVDVVVTAGCGDNFVRRLDARGVQVIQTSVSDPANAARAVAHGEALAPAAPHDH